MSRKRRGRSGGGDPTPPAGAQPDPRRLTSRHRATLAAIFATPVRPDIPWRDIEALFVALGGEVSEGRGSRVRVALRGERAVFHEPHPERVIDRGAVRDVRDFLGRAGVNP